MDLADFDYALPASAIAQVPVEPRDAARLLDGTGPDGPVHRHVRDLGGLVGPGDVIVVNDTRVLPARLKLAKATGGAVEVLLLAPIDGRPGEWEALVSANRRVQPGTELAGTGLGVVVGDDLGDGRRRVALQHRGDVGDIDAIEANGEVPLPPYIHRPLADPDRYQTVYAKAAARSVAAPTAGLHLTPELLQRCIGAGATVHRIELEVGLGTFRPISSERVEDHHMHHERYRIDPSVMEACARADRVLAVGTTVVRALESASATGEPAGDTGLFIRRGFDFRVVDTLLTNFHVPRSSLLVMLDAFMGDRWRSLYEMALDSGYRFLSFGDAMLVDRRLDLDGP